MSTVLTERWTPLKTHALQQQLYASTARFVVVPAGRRSGKTEFAKRMLIRRALSYTAHPDGWFVFSAPTHAQAVRIYWNDLKKMVPQWAVARVLETDKTIRLVTGAEITVFGMDQPERAEGRPLDGIVLDEYADMKPIVWTKHIRPALSTLGRPGWAWFIGVPEGRNHYYNLYNTACADDSGEWAAFTWKSSDILDPKEIAAAKRDLDPLTYEQEYEASFVNFEGRVYYNFKRAIHAKQKLHYNPNLPLIFCFDFNVKPGVAVVLQEQMYEGGLAKVDRTAPITQIIGEVWVPDNSNTPIVCRKLIKDWSRHKGDVLCYGDASGGARGTAQVDGSDWDLIRKELKPIFDDRLGFRYKKQNPKERARVNAVNSRAMAVDGTIRMLVDPQKAPHTTEDLEGVKYIEGGSGEIDDVSDPMLTHLSDGLGYFVEKAHPVEGRDLATSQEY